jgi:branched-chain amino acid aminotransferase
MFLNFNGQVREEGVALLRADNRGFRYGDGLFETMLVRQGKVRLGEYHLDRLIGGMRLLRLEFPGAFNLSLLESQIAELCARNGQHGLVRARLTVFRGGGGLFNERDRHADYILQTSVPGGGGVPGGGSGWRDEGLTLGFFPDGRKACDVYSGIKSNNYQLSTQAGMFAGEMGWDDCVLLNSYERVAETTLANIWWVEGDRVCTPPVSEGCVAGVMRRWLLEELPAAGYRAREEPIGPEGLAGVDEIFISNAIRGIQWVRRLEGAELGCRLAAVIHEKIIQKI